MQCGRIFWQIKDVSTFLFPCRDILLTCLAGMDGCILHNPDRFLGKLLTKIIDASHHHITMHRTKAALGLHGIVLAQKSEYVHAFAWSTFSQNRLAFCLPSIRQIGGETNPGFITIIQVKDAWRCLWWSIVSCLLFLLIFFWIWFSFETFASTSPTPCHRLSQTFQGCLPHPYVAMCSNADRHLLERLGACFGPRAHLGFLLWRTFGRTSWFGLLRQTSEASRCPGVAPMRDGKTIDLKHCHKLWSSMTLTTQAKTMGTLPDTMMLALFVYAL